MICPRVPSQQAAELGFETRQSEPRACGLRVCNGCGLSPLPACFHPYSYAFLFYVLDFWVPFFENAVIDITGKKYTVPTRPLNQKEHHLEKRGHSGQSLLTWDSVQKHSLDTGGKADWETQGAAMSNTSALSRVQ